MLYRAVLQYAGGDARRNMAAAIEFILTKIQDNCCVRAAETIEYRKFW
jgi:hypothetical protein